MVKVLSLNIWGAPYAKDRGTRVSAIVDALTRIDPDVILLQEVYLADNFRQLRDGLGGRWVHYRYFPSGLVGSGLLTFSKYPILDSAFHAFRMRGRPDDILRGDYYAQKGVGLTRIAYGSELIDIYNVHTHAQYEMDNDNEYAVYNETNLYEVARFVYQHSGDGLPVVLGGDLNTRPDQAGYSIVTILGQLEDVGLSFLGEHPITFGIDNPYVESADQCLDYLLVRGMAIHQFEVVLTDVHSSLLAYSDHYGLLAELSVDANHVVETDNPLNYLERLSRRVDDALVDLDFSESRYYERVLLAGAGVIDLWFLRLFASRLSRYWSRIIFRCLMSGVLAYVVVQLLQVGLNLRPRQRILVSIADELSAQLDARRLFDGRQLDEV